MNVDTMVSVPEDWLRVALRTLGPVIRGREAGRLSYKENRGTSPRRIVARTDEDRALLAGWREACRALGLDDDLRHW